MSADSFYARLLPAPLDGGFHRESDWIWCGSVIRADDGVYHMFASMWSHDVGFSPNWLTNSRVVRAVADSPEGPFTYAGEVLPPRGRQYWDGLMTHNPTIHRCGDTYLLFYTGTTYDAPVPDAASPGVPTDQRLQARANQRIGLATATDPAGPWTRRDAPILDTRPDHWDALITTNPAPVVFADGSVRLYYKSTRHQTDVLQYGAAGAPHWDGPYTRLSDDPIFTFAQDGVTYEDAYVWHDGTQYQMIFNDLGGKITGEHHGGAHASSHDGVDWRISDPPKAYSRTIRYADGSTRTAGHFERPQLLIQDGIPTHLYAATTIDDQPFWKTSHTWNMVVPLAPPQG